MFHALISHSICGAWLLISRISAIGTIPGQVRPSLPEASASIAVEALRMIVYSIPSRWEAGLPVVGIARDFD